MSRRLRRAGPSSRSGGSSTARIACGTVRGRAPPVDPGDETLFFRLIKAAFGQRRKTLANALGSALSKELGKDGIVQLIGDIGLDPRIRGEKLSLEQYAQLTRRALEMLQERA